MKSLLTKLFVKEKILEVRFCQKNLEYFLDDDTTKQFQKILSKRQVKFKEFECLNHCKLCEKKPYAEINKQLIKGQDLNEIISQISEMIDKK